MSTYERALTALLGTQSGLQSEGYPDAIDLPEALHIRIQSEVEHSGRDLREHSVSFRYRRDQWIGGISMAGPPLKESGTAEDWKIHTHVNRLHLLAASYLLPHLFFHSHPSPRLESMEEAAKAGLDMSDFSTDERDDVQEAVGRALTDIIKATVAMPSAADIVSSLVSPISSVAYAVAGDNGTFLWVRRNIKASKKLSLESLKPFPSNRRRAALDAVKPVRSESDSPLDLEVDQDSYEIDTEDIITERHLARAQALSSVYICYANTNLENPRLARLEV